LLPYPERKQRRGRRKGGDPTRVSLATRDRRCKNSTGSALKEGPASIDEKRKKEKNVHVSKKHTRNRKPSETKASNV